MLRTTPIKLYWSENAPSSREMGKKVHGESVQERRESHALQVGAVQIDRVYV